MLFDFGEKSFANRFGKGTGGGVLAESQHKFYFALSQASRPGLKAMPPLRGVRLAGRGRGRLCHTTQGPSTRRSSFWSRLAQNDRL